MRFGLHLPAFGELADPSALADLAAEAEAAGWDGVFLWDHLRFATDLPVADPWVSLAAMACATSRIRLGPLVTPLARRRVQVVARQSTTLDHLSGGRLVLGVGLGIDFWREFSGFGEPADDDRTRAAIVDESVEALLALWSGEPATVHGAHVTVDGVRFLPRPVQSPRIPVWCAATWPRVAGLHRAAGLDGVVPFDPEGKPWGPDRVERMLSEIRPRRPDGAGPFDVVIVGDAARLPADELAAAGATWILDGLFPDAPLAEARRTAAEGPPS